MWTPTTPEYSRPIAGSLRPSRSTACTAACSRKIIGGFASISLTSFFAITATEFPAANPAVDRCEGATPFGLRMLAGQHGDRASAALLPQTELLERDCLIVMEEPYVVVPYQPTTRVGGADRELPILGSCKREFLVKPAEIPEQRSRDH